MKQLYDITPPPELVREWCAWCNEIETAEQFWRRIATKAARWGADMELEACCEWLERNYNYPATNYRADHPLRVARRPKPPSLKELALAELVDAYDEDKIDDTAYDTIRRALEALDD